MVATGCGASPEKIEEDIETFVESHNRIGSSMLMDTMLIAVEQSGKEKGIDVGIDKDDYVYIDEVKDEVDKLKDLKIKPLKKINKKAFVFYKEAGELLEEAREGEISIDKFGSKVDKLMKKYEDELEDTKVFEEYSKLREKADMDEFEEYDSSEQFQKWNEVFVQRYEDECKKIMLNIFKGALTAAGSNIEEDFDIKANNYGGITMKRKEEASESDKKNEKESPSYEFVKKLAANREELAGISHDEEEEDDSAMLTIYGSKDGSATVFAAAEDKSKIDYLSADIYPDGDAKELGERLDSSIKAFCNEVDLNEKEVFKNIEKLYEKLTSKKFLKSKEAQEDIKKYDSVSDQIELDDLIIDVRVGDPEERQDNVGVMIMLRD